MNEQNIPSNIKAAIRLVAAAIRRIQEKQAARPPLLPIEKNVGTGV